MKNTKLTQLYDSSEPLVTVGELIDKLKTLPSEQEIVIYPKYDDIDGFHRHRFRLDNINRMEQQDGYEYCAILF